MPLSSLRRRWNKRESRDFDRVALPLFDPSLAAIFKDEVIYSSESKVSHSWRHTMILSERATVGAPRSQNPVTMARIAFVIAFASTVDAFRPVSLGSFTPALRISSSEIALKPNLGLRKPSAKSSLLGLRATATELEKSSTEAAVPLSREKMYSIAQVTSLSFEYTIIERHLTIFL